ncbi:MAG: hypothetical protein CVV03_03075 [Firmicutes bacterium HGW-Firmicutes-8]|nr:MAG: hypothetical protein CVV03_03075 [Firmicutes bacterium HGW-Firmicutes-8]
MEYLLPCIEQLDLAASLLDSASPIRSRLSLILIDNIVELMAHQKCEELIRQDSWFPKVNPPKYSAGDRGDALGSKFANKFRFLSRIGIISSDERDFTLFCHSIRNEAYHLGVFHDDFIFELAWNYHKLACGYFLRLKPSAYRVPNYGELSENVKKYFGKERWLFIDWETVATSLDCLWQNESVALRK